MGELVTILKNANYEEKMHTCRESSLQLLCLVTVMLSLAKLLKA